MKHSESDLRAWLDALSSQPNREADLLTWVTGPLQRFSRFAADCLGYAEKRPARIVSNIGWPAATARSIYDSWQAHSNWNRVARSSSG